MPSTPIPLPEKKKRVIYFQVGEGESSWEKVGQVRGIDAHREGLIISIARSIGGLRTDEYANAPRRVFASIEFLLDVRLLNCCKYFYFVVR